MSLEAIKYTPGCLQILDQLCLPNDSKYVDVKSVEDGWNVINKMQVRGAPAIGIVAALSLAVELHKGKFENIEDLCSYVRGAPAIGIVAALSLAVELHKGKFENIEDLCSYVRGAPAIGIVAALSLAVELHKGKFENIEDLCSYVNTQMDYLITARPTAVNIVTLKRTLSTLMRKCKEEQINLTEMKSRLLVEMEGLIEMDIAINKSIGRHGAEHFLSRTNSECVSILTHCNTGSLATGSYGTALGIVRRVKELHRLKMCYCTETRPYLQGSRLTAYELVVDKINGTLICDDMVAALMKQNGLSGVFVGADRIVANGDTANKIGTYQIAVLCKYHKIPFYVAAPTSSIDLSLSTGEEIEIEQRPKKEMITVNGRLIAPEDIDVWNPAFDVTPAELITGGIVTEFGVFEPQNLREKVEYALENGCEICTDVIDG